MLRKNKFDFVVYGKGYKRLVALFFAFFICSLAGFINLYGIKKIISELVHYFLLHSLSFLVGLLFFYILFGQEKYIYLKMK